VPNPLISVEGLQAARQAVNAPTMIDVRWAPHGPSPLQLFRAGHIPGAVRADFDTDLAGAPGPGGRHPLPASDAFQVTMRRFGVFQDRPVVVNDQRDSTIAARLWWMLHYFGHRDVRVLDGGIDAWTRAGLPVETGDRTAPRPGDFVAVPGGLPLLTVDMVSGVAKKGLLLDARTAERFRGEVEPLDPVAGHIPGAVSAPTFDNCDADGFFRPTDDLRARFVSLGVASNLTVGAYCGSGGTAAHEVLALRLAGFEAALYVGSWSEWISNPQREVARGA
jgi:thiosulfate/3-mercaptopyruvate sulfurtransferase